MGCRVQVDAWSVITRSLFLLKYDFDLAIALNRIATSAPARAPEQNHTEL